MCDSAVLGVKGSRAADSGYILGGIIVEGDCAGGAASNLQSLSSVCQKAQDPLAGRGVLNRIFELDN